MSGWPLSVAGIHYNNDDWWKSIRNWNTVLMLHLAEEVELQRWTVRLVLVIETPSMKSAVSVYDFYICILPSLETSVSVFNSPGSTL